MKLSIHAGAHSTEDARLLKSLLKDAEPLWKSGTAVPGPAAYRTLLKDSFAQSDAGLSPDTGPDSFWQEVLGERQAGRVVFSNAHFFGSQRHATDGARLYPGAARRLLQLQAMFPEDTPELFLCLRNPAAFLPAVLQKAPAGRVRALVQDHNPLQLRWSDLLQEIRTSLPGLPITVWCFEDLPFIWEDLLQALTGMGSDFAFSGAADMARAIMSREGGNRLADYLQEAGALSAAQKRRVISTFLDKFAQDDALEEELDLPGWTDGLVERLTEVYEADLDVIAALPGVTLIEPGPL